MSFAAPAAENEMGHGSGFRRSRKKTRQIEAFKPATRRAPLRLQSSTIQRIDRSPGQSVKDRYAAEATRPFGGVHASDVAFGGN